MRFFGGEKIKFGLFNKTAGVLRVGTPKCKDAYLAGAECYGILGQEKQGNSDRKVHFCLWNSAWQ